MRPLPSFIHRPTAVSIWQKRENVFTKSLNIDILKINREKSETPETPLVYFPATTTDNTMNDKQFTLKYEIDLPAIGYLSYLFLNLKIKIPVPEVGKIPLFEPTHII